MSTFCNRLLVGFVPLSQCIQPSNLPKAPTSIRTSSRSIRHTVLSFRKSPSLVDANPQVYNRLQMSPLSVQTVQQVHRSTRYPVIIRLRRLTASSISYLPTCKRSAQSEVQTRSTDCSRGRLRGCVRRKRLRKEKRRRFSSTNLMLLYTI